MSLKRSERREIREKLRGHFGAMVVNAEMPEETMDWSEEKQAYAEHFKRTIAESISAPFGRVGPPSAE